MKKQINNTNIVSKPGNRETTDSNITQQERVLLNEAGEDEEEHALKGAVLDNTDEDGELLNENLSGDIDSGNELDVPGSEADDYD